MPLEQLHPTSSVSYPLDPREPFFTEGKNDFASSRRSGSSKNSHFVSRVFPHPAAFKPRETVQADFLSEVALDALKTYIMHCSAGRHVSQPLGPFGGRSESG